MKQELSGPERGTGPAKEKRCRRLLCTKESTLFVKAKERDAVFE